MIVPVELVDAHCHLDLFPNPVALAREINTRRIHTIAVTNAPSVFQHTEYLATGLPYLHPAVGLHPELVATHAQEVDQIWPALKRTRFVGEIGLDYTTSDIDARQRQRQVFTKILERCAEHRDKVITIHSRRATSDTIDTIGERYPGRIILHWFTGTRKELERAVRFGFRFSINPAMIESQKGRDLISAMPADRVLTESDGPFARVGTRTADPMCAPIVLQYLAKLWRVSEDAAARAVLANFNCQ
jgi:TatD DNase family protein